MALDQINIKGVMYAFGTQADVAAASGSYVVGRRYVVTADGFATGAYTKVGTGFSSTVIQWDVTQAALDAVSALVAANTTAIALNASNLAAEITRATAAEGVNATAIATETTNRQTAVAATNAALAVEVSTRAAAITTLTTALAGEATARQGGDDALSAALTTEQTARITGDYNLGLRIDGEISARTTAVATNLTAINAEVTRATAAESALDTAYKAADSSLNTALTSALNTAVALLRDTTVADLIPVVYTAGQSSTLASLLGSGRPDGIYALSFTSDDVSKVMTVTGLPSGSVAGTGSITFGDIVRVVVDGGVVTTAVKIDDITMQKFAALDTSISALAAATTQSAIRSHFSATGWATYSNGVINVAKSAQVGNNIIDGSDGKAFLSVQGTSIRYTKAGGLFDATVTSTVSDIYATLESISSSLVQADNGLTIEGGKVGMGGALRKNTAVTGAYEMKFSNDTTVVDGVFKMPIWSVNPNGSKNTKGSTFVEVWFDGSGINYIFPN